MISHRHKCIFVHINKTGGTSIESWFGTSYTSGAKTYKTNKHQIARKMRKQFPAEWKSYFTFSFVRNPWDKEVSDYYFCKNHKYRIQAQTISEYFQKLAKSRRSMWNSNQLHWLCDGNGKQIVDFIGRFENLQEDFNIVCDRIGVLRSKLPHCLRGGALGPGDMKKLSDRGVTSDTRDSKKPYWEYYNDETRKIVAEKYAKDIEYFGYEFGE